MSIFLIQRTNQHRPAPVRKAVVLRYKNADYCALTQPSIMAVLVDMYHLSCDILSQIDWIAPSNSRAIIQIPIDCRLI